LGRILAGVDSTEFDRVPSGANLTEFLLGPTWPNTLEFWPRWLFRILPNFGWDRHNWICPNFDSGKLDRIWL